MPKPTAPERQVTIELPDSEAEGLLASLDAVFEAIDPRKLRRPELEQAVEDFRSLRWLVYCACSRAPGAAA